MRRALAVLLLGIFSLWLIAPVLTAGDSDSQLPLCCRRVGQHHCAEQRIRHQSEGRGIGTPANCPWFPQAGTTPGSGGTALIAHPAADFDKPFGSSLVSGSPQTLSFLQLAHCSDERGPPLLLS